MMKRRSFNWCFANIFHKLFLFSVLLEHCLGFNVVEDDFAEDRVNPSFYEFLEAWSIPQKIPRGYLPPTPRVGRRHDHQEKRQNLIPQPRIGRELEGDQKLAEFLDGIQNVYHDVKFKPFVETFFPDKDQTYSTVSSDSAANEVKYSPENSKMFVHTNKGSPMSSEETSYSSHLSNLESLIPDRNIDAAFVPKEDRTLLKETTHPGIDVFESEKPEVIFPLSRLDNARQWPAFDDKKQTGEYVEYPRSRIHPIIFHHPGLKQFSQEDWPTDSDLLRHVNVKSDGIRNALNEILLAKERMNKRARTMKLIPRIGRKKRSAPEEDNENGEPTERKSILDDPSNRESIWRKLKEIEEDYNSMMDKKNYRGKSSLMPRIGKKDSTDIEDIEKRVAAFTPRIGRAALIPRIGRSDPKFRLKIRGAFIPRIGRRAALIPRVGRSLSPEEETE